MEVTPPVTQARALSPLPLSRIVLAAPGPQLGSKIRVATFVVRGDIRPVIFQPHQNTAQPQHDLIERHSPALVIKRIRADRMTEIVKRIE